MAAVSATTLVSTIARAATVPKTTISSSVLGLPNFGAKGGKARCSSSSVAKGAGASMLSVASVISVSSPVLALVDERMSTEGTGLSLGLSNNVLGWILLGVFALIWSLYFVYTATLEEDEESGLSL